MRFNGQWMECDDGVVRPVIPAGVLGPGGVTESVVLLVDTGADRTVLSYPVVALLGPDIDVAGELELEGLSGSSQALSVRTTLWFLRDDGEIIAFNGTYAGQTDPAGRTLSVLGRDVLREFALIVDRPGDVVCLLHGRHRYVIQEV